MISVNQKEYLKKYLGIGKSIDGKKKKKKSKKNVTGLKVVDDDIYANLNQEIQQDLAGEDEEAPQIVSVIDDRPPSLRIDEETKTHLWKPIGDPQSSGESLKNLKFSGSIKLSKDKNDTKLVIKTKTRDTSPVKSKYDDDDASPPRKKVSYSPKDRSPPRRKRSLETDLSPPRMNNRDRGISPKRNRRKDNNISPPRRRDTSFKKEETEEKQLSRSASKNIFDISPPRQRQTVSDADHSPPRRKYKKNQDRGKDPSPIRKSTKNNDLSPAWNIKCEPDVHDQPRKRGLIEDFSLTKVKTEIRLDSESSKNGEYESPVKTCKKARTSTRKSREEEDLPLLKKDKDRNPSLKKSRWENLGGNSTDSSEKMQRTLDGKKAGLQNAESLVKETIVLKRKEDEQFKNMSAELSGRNAATVVRSRKHDFDPEEEIRKQQKEEENKKKYERWGRGVKQVEDHSEKIQNEIYEMSKPLARYADDKDLERYLKHQEREGDPMLKYLRQKRKKKAVQEGTPVLQQYLGDAPPNRYGIRPGYRWDGVDRSNGYEKKWFEVQNSRKANIEESYKWSTEDM